MDGIRLNAKWLEFGAVLWWMCSDMTVKQIINRLAATGILFSVSACGQRAALDVTSIELTFVSLDTIYAGSSFPSHRLGDARIEPVEVYTITFSSNLDLFEATEDPDHPWIYFRIEKCSTVGNSDINTIRYRAFLDEQGRNESELFIYNIYLDVDWYNEQISSMDEEESLCGQIVNPRMFDDGVHSNIIVFDHNDFIVSR